MDSPVEYAARVRLWLLDEPQSNLDGQGAAMIVQLLESHVLSGGTPLTGIFT